MTATHSGRRFRFVLLLVLGAIATANAFVYFIRLTDAAPLSPWEPAIAMEAIRLNEGLPLYEQSHATHMYGPLLTVAVAGIFKITGFNLLAARIVFSLIGLGLAAFLATLFCRGERLRWWLAAFILFSALNLRTSLIFSRPSRIASPRSSPWSAFGFGRGPTPRLCFAGLR